MAVSNLTPTASGTQADWVLLASSLGNNSSTITFTDIPAYRRLKIIFASPYNTNAQQGDALIRINSDTSSVYSQSSRYMSSSGGSWVMNNYEGTRQNVGFWSILADNNFGASRRGWGYLEIDNANNTNLLKNFYGEWAYQTGSGSIAYQTSGVYRGTAAAITSIQLASTPGSFATMTSPAGIYLFGAN